MAAELDELQGLQVLVVDDNETNLKILNEMLSHWGLVPTIVDSPQVAMELLDKSDSESPYQLVLSDVNMPDMDGFDFLAWVRDQPRWKDVTAMMLTSSRSTGDSARAKAINVAALLTKPIKQSQLLEEIGTAMGASGALRPKSTVSDGEEMTTVGPFHILLAEDHPPNQQLAVRLLERRGHTVVVANNGREAIEVMRGERFDLLLTDIQMPEMDGFAATKAIRESEAGTDQHLPIIAMTAHAMKGDAQRCLDGGMDGYVSKPVRRKALYAAIEDVMHKAKEHSTAGDFVEESVDGNEAEPVIASEPAFDEEELKEEYEGDEDLLADMIESYFGLVPKLGGEMEEAIAKSDTATVCEIAHTLKGGSGNFFAKAAFESAAKLEQIGKESDLSNVDEAWQRLREDLQRLKSELRRYIADAETK